MRYPWYVGPEDESAMTALAPVQLALWRAKVGHHKALPTINAKLNHRRQLEQSYDTLKTACAQANEPMTMAA